MKLEQIRARLAEISARIDELQASEELTDEQLTEMETLTGEFETLEAKASTLQKAADIKAKQTASAGRKSTPAAPANETVRVTDMRDRNEKFGGFESSAAWLSAVKSAGLSGKPDDRLMRNSTAYEKVGEDGGFLVPEEFSTAILKKLEVQESLMSQVTAIQVGGNALTINVDESQPWNQGIQAYWTAEGATITESKPSFKQASWRLQKLACLVKATDELLDDAVALQSYILNSAPDAFMNKINSAILSGNGVAKPLGIINSPFTVTVSKESMQTADTVNATNIVKMYSRMFPTSRSKGVWLINPAVEEQLRLAKDANDEYIYLSPGGIGGQLSATPFGTLLGRPVIPMMGSMPALGDLGDILFVDLSYYYMIRKAGGIKSATSIHLLFDKETTAFRFSMRLDGKCPFQAPVTTENGAYQMSAFVQLEAR